MANNTEKKGALKSTAEVVATTSTILVAGKTIASVVESTAKSVKDILAQNINDDIMQEPTTETLSTKEENELISEATTQNDMTNRVVESLTRNNNTQQKEEQAPISEPVEEIKDNSDITIVSTEPLTEDIRQDLLTEDPDSEPIIDIPESELLTEELQVESHEIESTGEDLTINELPDETGYYGPNIDDLLSVDSNEPFDIKDFMGSTDEKPLSDLTDETA